MQQEHYAVGDEEMGKMLLALTNDYGMDAECLSRLLGVNSNVIKNYKEHKNELPSEFSERCSFFNLLLMLYNIPNEEPDFKAKAFLDVLINEHKISAESIAKFAKVKEQDVLNFLKSSDKVPIETKYRLASVVMTLRLIFKTVEPKI